MSASEKGTEVSECDGLFDGMDLRPCLEELHGKRAADARILRLRGEASNRIYYRVQVPGGSPSSLIVMRLPLPLPGSDEGPSGKTEGPTKRLPFLDLQRHLEGRGIPVPRVYAEDLEKGLILLEDLGDLTFEDALRGLDEAQRTLKYGEAVDLLVRLHQGCAAPSPDCVAYQRQFDQPLLHWELEHFLQWGLEVPHGTLDKQERALAHHQMGRLVADLLSQPRGFVHRDYQSRNLMWARSPASPELVVIDFQDALLGPRLYDLVALLCDSYVALELPLQREMILRYGSKAALPEPARAQLECEFWRVALHRKLKDSGRFVFIDRVRSNPDFLPWYGPSMVYVGRALAQLPEQQELADLLQARIPGFPNSVPTPPANTGSHAERS